MGRVFDPLASPPDAAAAPYAAYDRLRREAPVYRNEERGFWALSRFDDVRAASRDWESFSNARGVDLDELGRLVFGPGDFLDTDPPEHDELRAVVRSRFTPKSVAALQPMIEGHVDELLAGLTKGRRPDLAGGVAWPLPVRVMCSVFGLPPDERSRVATLYRAVMGRSPETVAIPPRALEAAAEMRAYFVSQARERRHRPRDDLMTQIALARPDGEPLPDAKLAGICFVLFSAGIDTVTSLLGSAVLLLALHPDQRELVLRDPDRLPAAIEEALRYESPLQFNARTTTREVTLAGTTVPAGETVLLLYGAANRDERRYDDPARFDITREPRRHLAFGEGIHFCIGAPLARLQTSIALRALLDRMPNYRPAAPAEWLPAYNMRTLARLPVEVD
jgi:cytochrome P450